MAETTSLTYLSDYTGPQIDAAVKKISDANLENLQPKLISGTNIKTINGNAILGNGDLDLVQANITEAGALETLNNISVNGKIYKISNESGALTEIENIKNGITIVGKAKADQNGNIINTYYATKQEVETLSESVASAVETSQQAKTTAEAAMPKTGGDFTGAINVPEPTQDSNATTKKYVDNSVGEMQPHSVLLDQIATTSGTGFLKRDTDGYSLQQSAVAIDDNSIVENSAGALQLKQEYIDYLDNMLYKAPSISDFMLGDQYHQNNELGAILKFSDFKHREAYVKNIKGNLQLFKGSEVIKETPPTETVTTISFDSEIEISNTTNFRLKGIDIKDKTFMKDYFVGFYRYVYTNITQSSTAPTTGEKRTTTTSFADSGVDFTYNAQDYIYFYTVGENKKVQTYVLGQWADVDSEYIGVVDLTQDNGVVFGYNVYRIGPFVSSGTAKYRV